MREAPLFKEDTLKKKKLKKLNHHFNLNSLKQAGRKS